MAVGAPQDDACQIPSTNQNFGRSPPLHRRAPNVSRAGSVGFPQRMSRGLPECSAVACPTPNRTLSPTMPNDERLVSPWRAYLDLDFRVTEKRSDRPDASTASTFPRACDPAAKKPTKPKLFPNPA